LLFNRHSDVVENVAAMSNQVDPKPAIFEASGDVKPTVNAKL